jgi:hypothetical protein
MQSATGRCAGSTAAAEMNATAASTHPARPIRNTQANASPAHAARRAGAGGRSRLCEPSELLDPRRPDPGIVVEILQRE